MATVASERFRIGELARRIGATPRAVRYYEELGLLPGPARAAGAHRLYDAADETRLRDLLRVRDLLGLSLEELQEWVAAEESRARLRERWHAEPAPDAAARAEIMRESIGQIEIQLGLVRARRAALEELEDELTARRRQVRGLLAELEER